MGPVDDLLQKAKERAARATAKINGVMVEFGPKISVVAIVVQH